MVTVQAEPLVVSQPLQPEKAEPDVPVAVKVTFDLFPKFAEQFAGQLMPPGLLVTVPVPLPISRTASVKEWPAFATGARLEKPIDKTIAMPKIPISIFFIVVA